MLHSVFTVHLYKLCYITISAKAYTTLNIKPPRLSGCGYTLRLKIDTGASGNTLPLRTLRQMYGSDANKARMLKPADGVIWTAYNGGEIPCLACITMPCSIQNTGWQDTKFYVVDVPGPAVVGLPSCELLGLVTIHVEGIRETNSDPARTAESTRSILKKDGTCDDRLHRLLRHNAITSVGDLGAAYPEQFDKIGEFPGEAKLILKDDAEPFIDSPRKCSIHIKEKT